mmetsp:Transcript_24393/g.46295  ORF Transcript_24393/g.46295 Transcript_24393/m.46295 type:complete len:294 (-) Transcript_24393:209-1090(-)
MTVLSRTHVHKLVLGLFAAIWAPSNVSGSSNSKKSIKPCQNGLPAYVYPNSCALQGEDYVFVPMHKTGSSYISAVLKEHYGGFTCLRNTLDNCHLKITDRHDKKYVFGSTRDPYSSYVSLWSYGRLGKGGFHEQVVGVDYGKDDPESFQKWLRWVHGKEAVFDSHIEYVKLMQQWSIGVETVRYVNKYFQNRYKRVLHAKNATSRTVDHWIRCCDDLDGEINKAMGMVNLSCPKGDCRATKHKNESPHRGWREYYNNESLCLVQERDHWVFDTIGYDRLIDLHECSNLLRGGR